MAIYHLEAKVVSRGAGRSACAAAAYLSCSRIYNNYDGVQHDYTRKRGLVAQQVFLPPNAPPEWKNRETFWNAVEAAEKTKDSRLAREFVVALPVELGKTEWMRLLSEFIQTQFVAQGMCADMAIHDTDGHNPHAHILLTVRPLNPDGTWQAKTEKEYLCVKDGIEKGFTASEFKTAQHDGWEKQYPYKVGKKKVYMTPSAAEAQDLERASKYPKSTKYGRQNPIAERWNSEEQLCLWREAWAEHVNRFLEAAGREERIDHRSFADQGRDEQPTIHEGVVARALEKNGIVSDRCELNRQIKQDNALLKSLKAAITKLTDAVKHSIPAMAELLESIRARLLVLRFSANHARTHKEKAEAYLSKARLMFASYNELLTALQAKRRQRKALTEERDALPLLAISKKRELTEKIQGLTEEIEELKNEETSILRGFAKEEAIRSMAAQPNKRAAIAKQARKEISEMLSAAQNTAPSCSASTSSAPKRKLSTNQPSPPRVWRSVSKRKTLPLTRSARPPRKSCRFLQGVTQSQQWMRIFMRLIWRIAQPINAIVRNRNICSRSKRKADCPMQPGDVLTVRFLRCDDFLYLLHFLLR